MIHFRCKASVIQQGDVFQPGMHAHLHTAEPGTAPVHQISEKVKTIAAANVFTSAAEIVNDVLRENMSEQTLPTLPSQSNLARAANRKRQKMRPKDPSSVDFELEDNFIPDGFFRGDIVVDDCRHLIFATEQMLQLLSLIKNW